ncbi:MAG TPA: NAD(P)/FAD-dependent oxidoreductase [Thermoanaerobacterales bacterium]|nr:NAD(P)/FAD-dependent oxidoreductase [Thermoanaerobacterales bacterium]
MKKYDVIIIGSGPAGIFAALELIKKDEKLNIAIIEKGKDIEKRYCPASDGKTSCINCPTCSIVSGWGGAGAFSDGKLTLTTDFGGWLDEYMHKDQVLSWINYVDQIYTKFGATGVIHGTDEENAKKIQRRAATADLRLIPAKIKHLGTDKCFDVLKNMKKYLDEKTDIFTNTSVSRLIVKDNEIKGVVIDNDKELYADYVVCGPGREGSEWFAKEASRLGLDMDANPVDLGLRIEVPSVIMEHITDVVYESKLIFYSEQFDDRVRTFCMCPQGKVVIENNSGLLTVNGHSFADKKTENTNFALLVSKSFTKPFKEPISYGKYIAALANMLGDNVLVQRLGDLLSGRRSTAERIKRGLVEPTLHEATPGDLSLVLPYRYLISILEMLKALDKVAPGIYSRHTLLYGVEAKFYSSRLKLTPTFETQIRNLFAVGDGAGITRGLAQASVSGVIAAGEITKRM